MVYEESVVSFDIYNALGQMIRQIPEKNVQYGKQYSNSPPNDLKPGIFICRMVVTGRDAMHGVSTKVIVKRMEILR